MSKSKSNGSYGSGYTIQHSSKLELGYNIELDGGLAKGQLEDALTNKLKTVGFNELLKAIESL